MDRTPTLIIGAGQAGLATSHHLSRHNHPHVILERGRIGERWLSERWDGMHFQTPNGLVRLPGFPLPAADPDAFATAAEIAAYLTAYATRIAAPVRTGVAVTTLRRHAAGFIAETTAGPITAASVVLATGPLHRPRIPDLLPPTPGITQLHAVAYKAPDRLPPGAVLVVGTGASGAQIAEELMRAGRQVYLSVSRHKRAPRRYRGRDHVWWWIETGMDKVPVGRRSGDAAPLVHSGAYGGRTIDFRDFARQAVTLLGHARQGRDGVMHFAPDLAASIAAGDAAYLAFLDFVDAHIAAKGLDMPDDPQARHIGPLPDDAPASLDLHAAGIGTVIWATGYGVDFSWVDIDVLDAKGVPHHQGGVTTIPGLYVIGLPWLTRQSSAFLFGVGDDAARIADHIAGLVPAA